LGTILGYKRYTRIRHAGHSGGYKREYLGSNTEVEVALYRRWQGDIIIANEETTLFLAAPREPARSVCVVRISDQYA
jgi:hypothetical protein